MLKQARFHYAVTTLQAAFRGSQDRQVFSEELFVHRQKVKAVQVGCIRRFFFGRQVVNEFCFASYSHFRHCKVRCEDKKGEPWHTREKWSLLVPHRKFKDDIRLGCSKCLLRQMSSVPSTRLTPTLFVCHSQVTFKHRKISPRC